MKMNIKDFGAKIKLARLEYGYYQQTLADKLNIYYKGITLKEENNKDLIFRQEDISNIEANRRGVGKDKILLIITYFYEVHDLNPDVFFFKGKKIKGKNNYKKIEELIKKYEVANKLLLNNLKINIKKIYDEK